MKTRVYNFGAGPAMLPESLLKEAQAEFLNWGDLGVSIVELGHRTSQFKQLLEHAEYSLRELLNIPCDYEVLFLGGAARTQFSMIPLNLLDTTEQAGYFVTGLWSQLAFQEAQHLKKAYVVANEEQNHFTDIPKATSWTIKKDTSYVYFTPNETVNGTRFPYVPDTSGIPLIADMTSCLLTEPVDITQYGLMFAGAQKNIANAGLTIIIIRKDLLKKLPNSTIPTMLNYRTHAENKSLYATPPVFNCYLADKMFAWIKAQGGVNALFEHNCLKAKTLYDFLDSSKLYTTSVAKEARSLVNVCFSIKKSELEQKFITLAEQQGLYALKGHRTVGGLRASLYNAMPLAGVEALIRFMSEFEKDQK